MLRKIRTIMAGILMTMLFTVSVALAATPVEEADMVSRDMDNIYTMYLGMKKSDFMQNFSDVPNWKFSHKYQAQYPYRFLKEQCSYIRGKYTDPVFHGFMVDFDANDTINGIEVTFATNDEKTADAIYNVIQNNLTRQFGQPRLDNTYIRHHRIVMLYYRKDRVKSMGRSLWNATEGKIGERSWGQQSGARKYEISFQLGFPDYRLYPDEWTE